MEDPSADAVFEHAEPPGSGVQASWPGPPFTNPVRLAVVDSTNRYLRDAARAGAPEGAVVLADEQLAGRGRRDRTWAAPRGASLLCSMLFRPAPREGCSHLVPAVVALAARSSARRCAGVELALKWPNDLLAGEEKVAGILAELVGDPPAVVVGIGMNVSWPAGWPPPGELEQLVAGATTLERVAGRAVERAALEEALLHDVSARYAALSTEEGREQVRADYRAACSTIGREVRVELDASVVEGWATSVADDGRLVVELPGGATRAVDAGDVVQLRPRRT